MGWEDQHISIGTNGVTRDPRRENDVYRQVFATLVTHYGRHNVFHSAPILDHLGELPRIRATLIHGRRDVSGPAIVAWRLHREWPTSDLIIDKGDGHGGDSMIEAWCAANTRHADRLDQHPQPHRRDAPYRG